MEDWRPLLAFTQGNPLTITILARQALRGHHTSKDQIQAFVEQLRAGAATVTDDAAQGRGASLAASLDYGFTQAFTDAERATLALLALFQGFIDIDALVSMGDPDMPGGPVPAVAGLDREAGIALLDRAAEVGLLTAHGGGYYAVHPAIPWHLHALFKQHYGPDGSPPALHATRAWTTATSSLGNYYHHQYGQGHTEVTGVLGAEEANLLHARRLALTHGWHDLIIGPMQGLRILYEHTGRTIEWRRLVDELIPELTDPATGGPRPGREQEWAILTEYRVRIARDARDWPAAEQLQNARITWEREQAAAALAIPPGNSTTASATRSATSRRPCTNSARSCANKTTPAACSPTRKPWNCSSGSATGARKPPSRSTSGTPTKTSPPCATSTRPSTGTSATSSSSTNTTPSAAPRSSGSSATSPTSASTTPEPPGHPSEQLLRHLNDAADAYHQALGLLPDNAVGDTRRDPSCPGQHLRSRPATALLRSGTTSRPSSTTSARTTATGPAGPGTTPPSPSPTPGAGTTRCSTPAPPCATTRPSAPAPPPAPARPASSSPTSNRNQPMITNPIPATPPDPVLPCLRTGQDTWAAVAGRARCLPAGGVNV